jgi:hypothetical protein
MIKFENLTSLFSVNWEAIKNYIDTELVKYPKAGMGDFTGWSVQSKTGKYTDGWVNGTHYMSFGANGELIFDKEAATAAGFYPSKFHTEFTDIANDDLKSCIDQLRKLGLSPCRARLTQLVPGAESDWHTDGKPSDKIIRLHFVFETNPDCFFMHEAGKFHMEEKNVYLVNINYHHKVVNLGNTNRTHMIVDVTDTSGISKVH